MTSTQIPKKRVLTSRLLSNQVNTYISNREHNLENEETCKTGRVSPMGFIEILDGGIKSNGNESLRVTIPPEIDLSIRQNKGFSIFFWLIISKQKASSNISFILKKGNTVDQYTPTISLTKDLNLFVQLLTSKTKKATIYANKKIDPGHFYSVAVTFSIIYSEDITEVSIFLDGKLDTFTTVQGEPIHNQGDVFIGKPDSTSRGFKGTIADVIIVPAVLDESEILSLHETGLEYLLYSNGTALKSREKMKEVFDRKRLISKMAYFTKKPMFGVENLNLSNEKMKEIVQQYDKDEIEIIPPRQLENEKEMLMKANLKIFLQDEDNEIKVYKIKDNTKFIYTIFYLANKAQDIIEFDRVVAIFYELKIFLRADINEDFIRNLGEILFCSFKKKEMVPNKKGVDEEKIVIYFNIYKFFLHLEKTIDSLEEIQEKEEAEAAKYETKKTNKKTIKELYGKSSKSKSTMKQTVEMKRTQRKQYYVYQQTTVISNPNCIPEHENLLHKTQTFRNEIDDKNSKDLKKYQSTCVIKSYYEKPKNLPGENPNDSKPKILDQSQSVDLTQDNLEGENKRHLSPEEEKDIDDFLDSILDSEFNENKRVSRNPPRSIEEAKEREQYIIEGRKKKEEEEEAIRKQIEEEERKKKEKEKEESVKEEKGPKLFQPNPPRGWADGAFEVVINHCYDCMKHQMSNLDHYEYDYLKVSNDVGDEIIKTFQNCKIVINLDKREYMGCFDVYLRGTGLPSDKKGRHFIYRYQDYDAFPTPTQINDSLVAISMIYGSSFNLEKAQKNYLLKNGIGQYEFTKEYPENIPEEVKAFKENAEKKKKQTKQDESPIDIERTKLVCGHWGCTAEFIEKDNKPGSCKFHPGLWQFGSYNSYWPECWTCCEKKWDEEGCKLGKHYGIPKEKKVYLCLNMGEINPLTGRPDDICGVYYTEAGNTGCTYHSGYISKDRWTCCENDSAAQGCQSGNHETFLYPEEKAKLYFFKKLYENPGLIAGTKKKGDERKKGANSIKEQLLDSDFFKDAKKYHKKTNIYREKFLEDNKRKTRFCLNFGCKKREFTSETNNEKSCKCHPGKWDHGNSGTTMVQFIEERNSASEKKRILWEPHWTCCGKKWEEKGCTKCHHFGPFVENISQEQKEIKFPDIRLKLKFEREVSDKWLEYLEQFKYDKNEVEKIVKNYPDNDYSSLPKLCDKLRLNLLVLQRDPSYIMKYFDVIEKKGSLFYFCDEKTDKFDSKKFVEWWFMGYNEIYEKMHKPKKKEEKDEEEKKENEKRK